MKRHALAPLCLSLSLATPALATNVQHCVSTDAELAAVLEEAQFTAEDILVVQGTYDLKDSVWHGTMSGSTVMKPVRIHGGSRLLGGYDAGCTNRNVTSFNTTIRDTSLVDATVGDGVQPAGDFTVEAIAFSLRNGFSVVAGLSSNPIAAGSILEFQRNSFKNTTAGGLRIQWHRADDGGSTIRVVGNQVTDNAQAATQALSVAVKAGRPAVHLINNTVMNNAGGNSEGGLAISDTTGGATTFELYNNIVYNNSGGTRDFVTNTSLAILHDNLISSRFGPAPQFEAGTLSVDPDLQANYRPHATSPVVNSGTNAVPGGLPYYYIDDFPRVVGTRVDRGAYESGVDLANVQVVNTTADSGIGSLRAAITSINASNGGRIDFGISGGICPRVITLASDLPVITAPVTIDATHSIGWRPNTMDVGDDNKDCVILAAGAGGVTNGLAVASSSTDPVVIRGLGFSGFSNAAINLSGGRNHIVVGNRTGGSINGTPLVANGTAVFVGSAATNATIGGSDPASRNFFNGSVNAGVQLAANTQVNQVIGNYIGVGWNGAHVDQGNGGAGVFLKGPFNTVSRNLIGFNGGAGILFDGGSAHDNEIRYNQVGVDGDDNDLGNGAAGLKLQADLTTAPTDNLIQNDRIAFNAGAGVRIDVGRGNTLAVNAIFNNSGLGIDLGTVGVDSNDDDGGLHPVDEANRGQNYPVLTAGVGTADSGTVSGTLTSTPGLYTIDFYNAPGCDGSGNGEGRYWVGTGTVTVPSPMFGNQGTASFALAIAAAPDRSLADGSRLTATATDAAGNTSEFSACASYTLGDAVFKDSFE